MRLGVSSSLCVNSAEEWAKAQTKLGCKSVVFPLDCNADDTLIDEYVKAAQDNDLMIAEVGIWRNAIAVDEQERKANLDYSIRQLALADRIGAKCCVNVAGSNGPRWDGGYRENFSRDLWDKTVKMTQAVIDEVKPKNTYFTLESMPWMIPTGPKEYLKLMEDIDRDRFSVHLDIVNMINNPERYFFSTEFLEETFDLLGDQIKSCHLKDILLLEDYTFQLRESACGEGTLDIVRYAELATQYNPDMPMIIEHLDTNEAYEKSFKYVSDICREYITG